MKRFLIQNIFQEYLKISGLHNSLNLTFEEKMPFNITSKVGSLGVISLYLKSKKQIEEEQFSMV